MLSMTSKSSNASRKYNIDTGRMAMKIIYTVLLLAIFCILTGSPAFTQEIEFVGSTLYWSGVRDIRVVGDYAYCTFDTGL